MSDLAEFESYLRKIAPPKSGLRPFVCSGSPLECTVALVGYNPATVLEADFWDFWSSENGFDKARWFETYKIGRRNRPLKHGRTRRNAVSPTRKRIDLFLDGLGHHKCIETNLYWDASEDIASHFPADGTLLASLLERLPLIELVVCHHDAATRFVKSRFPRIRIEQVDHFANRKPGWSNAAAFALGQRIASSLIEPARSPFI